VKAYNVVNGCVISFEEFEVPHKLRPSERCQQKVRLVVLADEDIRNGSNKMRRQAQVVHLH